VPLFSAWIEQLTRPFPTGAGDAPRRPCSRLRIARRSRGRVESTRANAAGESLIEASPTVLMKFRVNALYPRPSEVGIFDQEMPGRDTT
jgi:hypothetical protein